MNFNMPPQSAEKAVEHIHSKQEVQDLLKQFITGEFRELQSSEDQDGLYFFNVEVAGELPGETVEYVYIRKTADKNPSTAVTTLQVAFYEEGVPVGGKTIADFIDNAWINQ